MKRIKNLLTFLSLTILILSCIKISPAGFWKSYKKDFIETKDSDQGPWGGHRVIKWKSKIKGAFKSDQMIDFAHKNGWQLIDSFTFTADSLSKLQAKDTVLKDYSLDILKSEVLSKTKIADVVVYRFKTGWIAVRPGSDTETDANGFVIITSNGSEMAVYHLWGD